MPNPHQKRELVPTSEPTSEKDRIFICNEVAAVPKSMPESSVVAVEAVDRPSVLDKIYATIQDMRLQNENLRAEFTASKTQNDQTTKELTSVKSKVDTLMFERNTQKLEEAKNLTVQLGYALQETYSRMDLSMEMAGKVSEEEPAIINQRNMNFHKVVDLLPPSRKPGFTGGKIFKDIHSRTIGFPPFTQLAGLRNETVHPSNLEPKRIESMLAELDSEDQFSDDQLNELKVVKAVFDNLKQTAHFDSLVDQFNTADKKTPIRVYGVVLDKK